MKQNPRLVVRPDKATAGFQIMSASMAALLLGACLYPGAGLPISCLFFGFPLCIWTGYTILRCRNQRIFVFDWGMVFCSMWGRVTKVRYEHLTSVRITTGFSTKRRVIYADFYRDDSYVASCCSYDENYSRLMKYLSERVPEKLDWAQELL